MISLVLTFNSILRVIIKIKLPGYLLAIRHYDR